MHKHRSASVLHFRRLVPLMDWGCLSVGLLKRAMAGHHDISGASPYPIVETASLSIGFPLVYRDPEAD